MMKLAAEDSVFNVFIFYQKWFFFLHSYAGLLRIIHLLNWKMLSLLCVHRLRHFPCLLH